MWGGMAMAGLRRRRLPLALMSCATTLITVFSFAAVAGGASAAPAPATIQVTCTSPVSYGDEVDCQAASVDSNGNFGEPGTFTFDAGHVLPASWSSSTCVAPASNWCFVQAVLTTPPGAAAKTYVFPVSFVGNDGSTASAQITVDVGLRSTTTTLDCGDTDQVLGAVVHCVISVTDGEHVWDMKPAQLPAGVAGMTASSSHPGDVLTYDQASPGGSTCVAAVMGNVISCGFTILLDHVHGLRTVTAVYGGDPAADEVPSQASVQLSNGIRAVPVVTLSCPASVPAEHLQTTCGVTVHSTGAGPGAPVPTGTVGIDQAFGQPVPWDSPDTCTLVAGACTIVYQVFPGAGGLPPPPVRALYSGDDNYQSGSGSEVVAITLTPVVALMTCDSRTPAAMSLLHCRLSVSTVDGAPVPVSPHDAMLVATSTGTITCDYPAVAGCGHYTTDTATVAGFTVHLGQGLGAQSVSGYYTGDDFAFIDSGTAGFSFTTVPPAIVITGPGNGSRATTRTSVTCGTSTAYLHPARCTVKVVAVGGVPSGTVRLVSTSVPAAFTARSCRLAASGRCSVTITVRSSPPTVDGLTVSYAGSSRFLPSSATAQIRVRAVATALSVRCNHTTVRVHTTVHCVAAVRTEFGAPAAPPVGHSPPVSVSARGDVIAYDSGKSCHWRVVGTALTCGFSLRSGSARGLRTITAYYAGNAPARQAASHGKTTLTVKA